MFSDFDLEPILLIMHNLKRPVSWWVWNCCIHTAYHLKLNSRSSNNSNSFQTVSWDTSHGPPQDCSHSLHQKDIFNSNKTFSKAEVPGNGQRWEHKLYRWPYYTMHTLLHFSNSPINYLSKLKGVSCWFYRIGPRCYRNSSTHVSIFLNCDTFKGFPTYTPSAP